MQQPTIQTERLILRPFQLSDAADVQRLAGDREVAVTTVSIPHPYPDGVAQAWIAVHPARLADGSACTFAVVLRKTEELVGATGLRMKAEHGRGELGYYVGKPYWNHGYATEAGRAVLKFGFEVLGLRRIFAECMSHNPASARVLEKLGMRHEGTLRSHMRKWDAHVDMEVYGILREEFEAS